MAYCSLDGSRFASAKRLAAAAIMAGSMLLSPQAPPDISGALRRETAAESVAVKAETLRESCAARLLHRGASNQDSDSRSIVSNIWSGYIALSDSQNPGHAVTAVSGVWKVAKIPNGKTDSDSSQWVGIGGCVEGDNTLIQAGTSSDCLLGTTVYYAWLETMPNYPIITWRLGIRPDDIVAVSIKMLPDKLNKWEVDIKDVTTSGEFSRVVYYRSNQMSAEWVMERASRFRGGVSIPLPLGDFGTVYFGKEFSKQSEFDNNVTMDGREGSITGFYHRKILMVYTNDNKIAVEAKPSKLYNGSSFRVSRLQHSIRNPVGWSARLLTAGTGTQTGGNTAASEYRKPYSANGK